MDNKRLNKTRHKEVALLLCEFERPSAPDTLIKSYQDFLDVRDYLPHYRFNLKVLKALVSLTLGLWHTEKRISRLSLLVSIKRYGFPREKNGRPVKNKYSKEFNHQIFLLYRNVYEASEHIIQTQLSQAKQICNFLLIGAPLPDEDLLWLQSNLHLDNRRMNRLLRYPEKSTVISNWVLKHYVGDLFSTRRAEATGWVLDEQPDFVIKKDLLINDLLNINELDRKAIEAFENGMDFHAVLREINNGGDDKVAIKPQEDVELTLVRRNYAIPKKDSDFSYNGLPDFENIVEDFVSNIDSHHSASMLWAIAYSRLASSTKMRLLKKHYMPESHHSFMKIAWRYRYSGLLRWLKKELSSKQL